MYRFMLNRLDPQGGTPEVGGRDVLVMLLNQASQTMWIPKYWVATPGRA